jgi:hypothetical protein
MAFVKPAIGLLGVIVVDMCFHDLVAACITTSLKLVIVYLKACRG